MKRCQSFLLFLSLFIFPAAAHSQAWSGIIAPNRAMDWSQAGIQGGLPDTNWPICATISPYTGDGSAIQNAVLACRAAHPTGGVVLLGAGTFTLSSGATMRDRVVIRGAGTSSTIINYSAGASGCNGQGAFFCGNGSGIYRGNPSNPTANWTAGYAKGATQITLSSVSGITVNQTVLILNQCDTGYSGATCTGAATDNNGYFVCANPWLSAGVGCNLGGEASDGPDWRNSTTAWQQENVLVTAINQGGCGATCVTISPPLHHANWSSAQSPQAVISGPQIQPGVENLTLNAGVGGGTSGIAWNNVYQGFVSGVIVINGVRGAAAGNCVNCLWQNNYFYGNPTNYGDNAGVMVQGGGYNLVVNNICQKVHLCFLADGICDACVVAYNFSVNQQSNNDLMGNAVDSHAGPGNDYTLLEGNVIDKFNDDGDHGGHLNMTKFRNLIHGWESCANGQCGGSTAKATQVTPYISAYGSRYAADIANVFGTPGYHTRYFDNTGAFNSGMIYGQGVGYNSQPADPLVPSTSIKWGNYDVVTGTVRWCGNSSDTGWSTTCASTSEIPTTAPTYPSAVPTLGDTGAGQSAMPASFIYAAKPSWFGSVPWPPIGPDVSNGNVGQCAGPLNVLGKFNGVAATNSAQCAGSALNTAWGGHVNAIPAMNCYLNVMGGPPDGTGSLLSFDPNTCYQSNAAPPPAPPTQVKAVVN
jgi:Pectate lyase superfamily protein